ncbi:hypothetical protein ZWY2020_014382 [Hordeum vulgare]|nr:hypothetical protein ZWY2020_014382 [Hordeum vulgare]
MAATESGTSPPPPAASMLDHVLGTAPPADIDGLTGRSRTTSTRPPVLPEIHIDKAATPTDRHGEDIREQIFGRRHLRCPPSMSGFAQNARDMGLGMAQNVMSGFAPDSVPVYAALADEFTVFDRC